MLFIVVGLTCGPEAQNGKGTVPPPETTDSLVQGTEIYQEAQKRSPVDQSTTGDPGSLVRKEEGHSPHPPSLNKAENRLYRFLRKTVGQLFSQPAGTFIIRIIDIIFEAPALILLVCLILLLIINMIIVFCVLILTSVLKNIRLVYEKRLDNNFEPVLMEYLFEEANTVEITARLKKFKHKREKNMLISMLFNYQQNLSGEYREKILELYKNLRLFELSAQRISSWFTHKRIKGIKELSSLYPSGAGTLILKYVKDKNDLVRSEAQIAYAYLDREASFAFLDHLLKPFSKWSQLNVLSLVRMQERTVPSFDKWIDSPNRDVQIFSIRMIHYCQQNENAHLLLKKLDHPDEQVRYYAYQAVRGLNYIVAKEIAKNNFINETVKNRIEILKIVESIGDRSDFEFLKHILEKGDVRLRLQACKALYNMGMEGRSFLDEYNELTGLEFSPYIDHIKEIRN